MKGQAVETKESTIEGQNGLDLVHYYGNLFRDDVRSSNTFVLGDSLADRETMRLQREEQEREQRETIARETNRYKSPSSGNGYPYGWCTYYVKEKKPEIPNTWGNAINWPTNSDTPRVGGIIQTRESRLGHVALVISYNETSVTFSEMNGTAGWGKIDTRTLPINSWVIKGYIND